jgi:hypothetical protein
MRLEVDWCLIWFEFVCEYLLSSEIDYHVFDHKWNGLLDVVTGHHDDPRRKPMAQDSGAGFYARFPDARRIGFR